MNPETLKSASGTRNQGIDALRILSMFMVVVLHILGVGGITKNTAFCSPSFLLAYTMEAAVICCVNCYGLISGYVGINARYRYTNLVLLWLQVALYSIAETAILYFVGDCGIDGRSLLRSAFPVSYHHYWYFSAYTALFFFMPLLNLMVSRLNRKQAKVLCIGSFLLFCVLPTAMNTDCFTLGGGYTVLWLMILYIIGGCIRRFDFLQKVRKTTLGLVFVSCVLTSVGFLLLMRTRWLPILEDFFVPTSLIIYTSPTIFLCALCLLLLFARMRQPAAPVAKVIGWISPAAFGVYLIHCHPDMLKFLFEPDRFRFLADLHPLLMAGGTLGIGVVIFTACALIDRVRFWAFRKLKLKERLLKLEERYIGDLWTFH